jgi:hypothetical protein
METWVIILFSLGAKSSALGNKTQTDKNVNGKTPNKSNQKQCQPVRRWTGKKLA